MAPPDVGHLAQLLEQLLRQVSRGTASTLTGRKTISLVHFDVDGEHMLGYAVSDNWTSRSLERQAARAGAIRVEPRLDVSSRDRIYDLGAAWHSEQIIISMPFEDARIHALVVSRPLCPDCQLAVATELPRVAVAERAGGRYTAVDLSAIRRQNRIATARAGAGGLFSLALPIVADSLRDERERRELGFVPVDEDSAGAEALARALLGQVRVNMGGPRADSSVDIPQYRAHLRAEFAAAERHGEITIRYESEHEAVPYRLRDPLLNHESFTVTYRRDGSGQWQRIDSDGAPAGLTVPDVNRIIDPRIPDADIRAALLYNALNSEAELTGPMRPDLRVPVPEPGQYDASSFVAPTLAVATNADAGVVDSPGGTAEPSGPAGVTQPAQRPPPERAPDSATVSGADVPAASGGHSGGGLTGTDPVTDPHEHNRTPSQDRAPGQHATDPSGTPTEPDPQAVPASFDPPGDATSTSPGGPAAPSLPHSDASAVQYAGSDGVPALAPTGAEVGAPHGGFSCAVLPDSDSGASVPLADAVHALHQDAVFEDASFFPAVARADLAGVGTTFTTKDAGSPTASDVPAGAPPSSLPVGAPPGLGGPSPDGGPADTSTEPSTMSVGPHPDGGDLPAVDITTPGPASTDMDKSAADASIESAGAGASPTGADIDAIGSGSVLPASDDASGVSFGAPAGTGSDDRTDDSATDESFSGTATLPDSTSDSGSGQLPGSDQQQTEQVSVTVQEQPVQETQTQTYNEEEYLKQ